MKVQPFPSAYPAPRSVSDGKQTVTTSEETDWLCSQVAEDDRDSVTELFLHFRVPNDPARLEPGWQGLRQFHLERAQKIGRLTKSPVWSQATSSKERREVLRSLLEVVDPGALGATGETLLASLCRGDLQKNLTLFRELAGEQGGGRPIHKAQVLAAADDLQHLERLEPEHKGLYRRFRQVADGEFSEPWMQVASGSEPRARWLDRQLDGIKKHSRDSQERLQSLLWMAAIASPEQLEGGLASELKWLAEHRARAVKGFGDWSDALQPLQHSVATLGGDLEAMRATASILDKAAETLDGEELLSVHQALNRGLTGKDPAYLEGFKSALESLKGLPAKLVGPTLTAVGGEPSQASEAFADYERLRARLMPSFSMHGQGVVDTVFRTAVEHPREDALEVLTDLVLDNSQRWNTAWLETMTEQAGERLGPDSSARSLSHELNEECLLTGGFLSGSTRSKMLDLTTISYLINDADRTEARDEARFLIESETWEQALSSTLNTIKDPQLRAATEKLAATPDGLATVRSLLVQHHGLGFELAASRELVRDCLRQGKLESLPRLGALMEQVVQEFGKARAGEALGAVLEVSAGQPAEQLLSELRESDKLTGSFAGLHRAKVGFQQMQRDGELDPKLSYEDLIEQLQRERIAGTKDQIRHALDSLRGNPIEADFAWEEGGFSIDDAFLLRF